MGYYNEEVLEYINNMQYVLIICWLQNIFSDYQCIWLNSIDPFVVDGSFLRRYEAKPGDIITWKGHSGIILHASKNNPNNKYIPEVYMMSKWGGWPIFAHYRSESPYSDSDDEYAYYYR